MKPASEWKLWTIKLLKQTSVCKNIKFTTSKSYKFTKAKNNGLSKSDTFLLYLHNHIRNNEMSNWMKTTDNETIVYKQVYETYRSRLLESGLPVMHREP